MISPKRERGSTVSIGSTGITGSTGSSSIVALAEQFLAVPAKWEKQMEKAERIWFSLR